jgi:hypothetical protein
VLVDVTVIEQRYHPFPTAVILVDVGEPAVFDTTPVDKLKMADELGASAKPKHK